MEHTLTLLTALLLAPLASFAAAERPNVLVIYSGQQFSGMMSCTGNPWLKTPAMDRLATNGIRSERASSVNPRCVPSRVGMLTGYTPSRFGIQCNADSETRIPAAIHRQTMGWLFRDAGSEATYAGKAHFPGKVEDHGFDLLTDDQRGKLETECVAAAKSRRRARQRCRSRLAFLPMKTSSLLLSSVFLSLAAQSVPAAIKTELVEYRDGETVLEGFVAYDDAIAAPQPGVLVVHDWTGLQDYAKRRTTMLAELGYIAFAADIYGKGVRPTELQHCAVQAGTYKSDLPLLRRRVTLGFDQLLKRPGLDAQRTAAIGYCFGGTSALELARSGAPVSGVVSFHGGLGTTLPAAAGGVKAKVLVCHGADDPFVKPAEQAAFKEEMAQTKVSYDFIAYPGAVHSFTKAEAGNDNSKGQAYNEAADKKSWQDMRDFFAKIFAK